MNSSTIATHNYGSWQQVTVRYRTRENRYWFLSSLARRDNKRAGILELWFSQGWLKSVFFLVIAMFSFAILYTMKSHASICFWKTASVATRHQHPMSQNARRRLQQPHDFSTQHDVLYSIGGRLRYHVKILNKPRPAFKFCARKHHFCTVFH